MTTSPVASVRTEYGRSIWKPGKRLQVLGYTEVDCGVEDDPQTRIRIFTTNRDAQAALQRARTSRRRKAA